MGLGITDHFWPCSKLGASFGETMNVSRPEHAARLDHIVTVVLHMAELRI